MFLLFFGSYWKYFFHYKFILFYHLGIESTPLFLYLVKRCLLKNLEV